MFSKSVMHWSTVLCVFFMQLVCMIVRAEKNGNGTKIRQFQAFVKPRIFPNYSQVHSFIDDDLFAYRWLQDNNFNPEQATQKLMQHLSWRQREKIDVINLEDWSYFQQEYPQFVNTLNTSEIPVTEFWLSDWNVRRAVLAGQTGKLRRWMTYLLEMTQRDIYKNRRGGNHNITSAIEIIDLEGFNILQHGCINCVSLYTSLSQEWEKQYPGLWKSVYMINAGPVFRSFLGMGNSFQYDPHKVLRLYTDKTEWLPRLDREISKKQRSIRFGGIIDRASME